MQRIGVDIGGTKTEIVALDDAGGERLRRREPTPHGAYDHAVQSLATRVLKVPRSILMPIILLFCIVGSFAINNSIFGVIVILAFEDIQPRLPSLFGTGSRPAPAVAPASTGSTVPVTQRDSSLAR